MDRREKKLAQAEQRRERRQLAHSRLDNLLDMADAGCLHGRVGLEVIYSQGAIVDAEGAIGYKRVFERFPGR